MIEKESDSLMPIDNDAVIPVNAGLPKSPELEVSIKSLDRFIKRVDKAWPEANGWRVLQGMTALYIAKSEGYLLDISAYSAAVNIPRTTAHRALNEWQTNGLVVLERIGRKTIVHMTDQSLRRLESFAAEPS